MTHGITLTGYCRRAAGHMGQHRQEQLAIESASDEWQGALTATF